MAEQGLQAPSSYTVELGDSPQQAAIVLSMGPHHPSTHGVLRVVVTLDGERIVKADPDLGYLHRCFEKVCENLTYPQVMPYTDRNDYVAAITNEWAYALAIEKLLGIQVPERAEYIRVIAGELQRISSHLIWFGTFCVDLGAFTPFLYAFREREVTYDLFEMMCGARLTYNYFRIGGVRNDLSEAFAPKMLGFLDDLEGKLVEYDKLFTGNPIFEARSKGIGILKPEDAIAYGTSGPVLRGSGIKWDLRKAEPYSVYNRFDFEIPVGKNGDIYDRYIVRMEEIRQSSRIIRQALETMPQGEVQAKVPRRIKPEPGDYYARVESPRGEVGCYLVSDGSEKPYRLKWRAPSFVNLQILSSLAKGMLIADLVALLGNIDIILGEVDR